MTRRAGGAGRRAAGPGRPAGGAPGRGGKARARAGGQAAGKGRPGEGKGAAEGKAASPAAGGPARDAGEAPAAGKRAASEAPGAAGPAPATAAARETARRPGGPRAPEGKAGEGEGEGKGKGRGKGPGGAREVSPAAKGRAAGKGKGKAGGSGAAPAGEPAPAATDPALRARRALRAAARPRAAEGGAQGPAPRGDAPAPGRAPAARAARRRVRGARGRAGRALGPMDMPAGLGRVRGALPRASVRAAQRLAEAGGGRGRDGSEGREGGDAGDQAGARALKAMRSLAGAAPRAVSLPRRSWAGAAQQARPEARPARPAAPAPPRPSPAGRGPLAALQARRNQDRSRRLAAARRLAAGASPAPVAGGPAAKAAAAGARAVAGAASAAVGAVASALLPALAAALAVCALAAAAASMFSCAATVPMLSGSSGGQAMAAAALREYEGGLADGTCHHGDSKYWDYVRGGGFVDGSETPWCACFVSWCADQCGYVESGLLPQTASVEGFLSHFGDVDQAGTASSTVMYISEYTNPQPGDLICYGHEDRNCTDHIGVVVAVDYGESGAATAFYTVEGNTSSTDLAEGLYTGNSVGKKTYLRSDSGGWGLPLWWLDAKVIRPNYPASAVGDVDIPETCTYSWQGTGEYAGWGGTFTGVRVGTFASWECEPLDNREWDTTSACYAVMLVWGSKGRAYDERSGVATIDGKYMIACTETFGQPGDEVVFYLDDGTELDCVVTDTKSPTQEYGAWPANEWGHPDCDDSDGAGGTVTQIGVLEFFGHVQSGASPWVTLGYQGRRVASATNMGAYIAL